MRLSRTVDDGLGRGAAAEKGKENGAAADGALETKVVECFAFS